MSNSPRIEVSEAQAAAITLSTAREVPEHSSDGRRWTGLAFFSRPRSTEEEYLLSQQPGTINYPLSGHWPDVIHN